MLVQTCTVRLPSSPNRTRRDLSKPSSTLSIRSFLKLPRTPFRNSRLFLPISTSLSLFLDARLYVCDHCSTYSSDLYFLYKPCNNLNCIRPSYHPPLSFLPSQYHLLCHHQLHSLYLPLFLIHSHVRGPAVLVRFLLLLVFPCS